MHCICGYEMNEMKWTVGLQQLPIEVSLVLVEMCMKVLCVCVCVLYRVTMTHAAIPKEEREKIGITDTLVRYVDQDGGEGGG